MTRTVLLIALGAILGSAAGIAAAEWRWRSRPPAPVVTPPECGALVEWREERLRRDEVGANE